MIFYLTWNVISARKNLKYDVKYPALYALPGHKFEKEFNSCADCRRRARGLRVAGAGREEAGRQQGKGSGGTPRRGDGQGRN